MANCKKCGAIVVDGGCLCTAGEVSGRYPTIAEVKFSVAQILTEYQQQKSLPDIMPRQIDAAADWLMTLFEKHGKNESPYRKGIKSNESAWHWPYAERASRLAHQFLHLDQDFQTIIVNARHDHVAWRGDSKEEFYSVINETGEMRKVGVEDYRKDAMKKMRALNFG